jgi:diguanylate cyclase (GGDEF)-like protein
MPMKELERAPRPSPMPMHAATGPTSGDEHLMARIAGAIWALIGALALLATIEPIRSAGTNITAMRALGLGAAVVAGTLLFLPEGRRTKRLFDFLVVVTVLYIGALAYAGGTEREDLMLPVVFVVVLSAYFFPWQRSLVHLGLTEAMMGGYLLLAESVDGNYIASLNVAITSVWALALVLRRNQIDRESRIRATHDVLDAQTGLLSPRGLDQALDAELSRAVRHARPLSLIYLEVYGPDLLAIGVEKRRRVATTLARTLLSRIRTEDRVARLDHFKFAVLAPETGESGAAAISNDLSEQVRRRMLTLGYHLDSFSVAVGWADYQYDELPKEELMKSADASLAAAILANEGISFPPDVDTLRPEALTPFQGAP